MIHAVIFDLDGVLVSTDEFHFRAWAKLAKQLDIPFDRTINERMRGVGRMESLEILLEKSEKSYTAEEKLALADRKNQYYRQSLQTLAPEDLLPGAFNILVALRDKDIKIAVASASKNATFIIERLNLSSKVDVLIDGNQSSCSKPDPESFLLAAERLGLKPEECLVVEDAPAGVEAARRAGMHIFAIGTPRRHPNVEHLADGLANLSPQNLLGCYR